MSKQHYIKQDKLRLPLSGNLYYVEINGKITDNQCNEITTFLNQDGYLCVNITWINGYGIYRVAELVALTFKPVNFTFQKWSEIWVLFKDGNKLNLHPSNLIWKFPTNGLESTRFKGFYYIPNFTKYIISKDGIVIQNLTGNVLNGSVRETGYVFFTLAPDVSDGRAPGIGRHRIIGLVFLDYNEKVEELEVNHIDGIPGNDNIENLEWSTRKENIKHAYENNLRNDNKNVLVIDHNTGIITKYYSAYECERQLGLSKSVVHHRIKNSPGKIFPSGHSFEYENANYEKCSDRHYGIKVKLTNTLTNEVIYFDSMSKCSIFLKVSKKVIQRRLKNNNVDKYKEYIFEKVNAELV